MTGIPNSEKVGNTSPDSAKPELGLRSVSGFIIGGTMTTSDADRKNIEEIMLARLQKELSETTEGDQ